MCNTVMASMNRRALLFCPVSLVGLSLNGCKRSTKSTSLIPVKIMVGRSTSFCPVLLAQQLGFYEKHGLAASIEDTNSTTKTTQALLGGSVDVAGGLFENTLSAAAQGKPIKSFVTLMSGDSRALVVSPRKSSKIRRVEDLKGAVIGVSAIGSPNQFLATSIAHRHALSRRDVSIVAVGVLATAIAALEHDKVDAAVLSGSAINLYKKRYPEARILVDTGTTAGMQDAFGVEKYATAVLYSTPVWLAGNKETARRVTLGTVMGLRWIQNHSPEDIAAQMPEAIRADPESDRDAMKALKRNFSSDGRMSVELAAGVKRALVAVPENSKIQEVDLSETFTNEFLEPW
jgi:NitT/TauT family transport system substrate-binding protein